MSDQNDLSWFALYLGEAKKEFEARDAILGLGCESFIPVEHKWIARRPGDPRNKLKRRRAYPLCIRYGFVGMPPRYRWSDVLEDHPEWETKVIKGTDIPARPVGMTPAAPTRIAPDQIAYLAALCDRNVPYAASINPHRAILSVKEGDTAKILSPALYGHFGRVDEVMVKEARVAIQFLGSLRQVTVPLDELEAA